MTGLARFQCFQHTQLILGSLHYGPELKEGENRRMMEEDGDVEACYVCVNFTQICEFRSAVPRGSPRLANKEENHIFVMSLARFNFFCNGFSAVFVTHKINSGIPPLWTQTN